MYKRFVILCLLLVSSYQLLLAQNNTDSYIKDTTHVERLIDISREILFVNPDSTRLYIDTIGEISKRINYEKGLYSYYNLTGNSLGLLGENKAAIDSYKEGLKRLKTTEVPRYKAVLLSNIGLEYWRMFMMDSAAYYYDSTYKYCERHGIQDIKSKVLYDLSNIYIDQNNYIDAAKNLFQLRSDLQESKDSMMLVYLYGTLGVVYTNVGDFEMALESYFKSIELDLLFKKVNILAYSYSNIGHLYFSNKQLSDSALHYYKKSVDHALPHLKNNFQLSSNINTGNIFLEHKQYDSAYHYYNKAYLDTLLNYFPDRYTATLINIGVYYHFKGDFEKAKKFLTRGVVKADSLSLLEYESIGLKHLYKIDSAENDIVGAMNYLIDYHATIDSMDVFNDNQKIASLEFEQFITKQKYNNQLLKKENDLNAKVISNQKILLLVFIVALILVLIIVIILINGRKKRKLLLRQISAKNNELVYANEELLSTNEVLQSQREELNNLNLTKDKFFSIIGHDLKSPFNHLLGMLQILHDDWENITEDNKIEYLKGLLSTSKNTFELLESLLTWGRAQQGLLDYMPDTISVYKTVESVVKLFEAQLTGKEIDLEINISQEAELVTDSRYFSQIIQNLINNAIKFTHKGGKIIINYNKSGKEKAICVIDNGIGIPQSKIETIFNLDSDFGRPGTDNERSTGMGLILCKEYANIIGANIKVDSIEENLSESKPGGSSFCIVFDN